ncbi:MAG: hypothetical protein AB8G96_01330 [Phycisphaerales bacterium]
MIIFLACGTAACFLLAGLLASGVVRIPEPMPNDHATFERALIAATQRAVEEGTGPRSGELDAHREKLRDHGVERGWILRSEFPIDGRDITARRRMIEPLRDSRFIVWYQDPTYAMNDVFTDLPIPLAGQFLDGTLTVWSSPEDHDDITQIIREQIDHPEPLRPGERMTSQLEESASRGELWRTTLLGPDAPQASVDALATALIDGTASSALSNAGFNEWDVDIGHDPDAQDAVVLWTDPETHEELLAIFTTIIEEATRNSTEPGR